MNKKRALFKAIILLLIVIFSINVIKNYNLEMVDLGELKTIVNSYGILAPIMFMFIVFLFTITFLPATPLMIAAGIFFGVIPGTIYIIISTTLGSLVAFYIARFLGKDWIDKALRKRYPTLNKYGNKIEENGFFIMLILRLVSFIPFNVLNFLMGLTRIKIKDYFYGTLLGSIPATIIIVNIGTSSLNVKSPRFIFSIVLLLLLGISPYIYKRLSKS